MGFLQARTNGLSEFKMVFHLAYFLEWILLTKNCQSSLKMPMFFSLIIQVTAAVILLFSGRSKSISPITLLKSRYSDAL